MGWKAGSLPASRVPSQAMLPEMLVAASSSSWPTILSTFRVPEMEVCAETQPMIRSPALKDPAMPPAEPFSP